MRMQNGYGSIYKLKGKRRKPYAVRVTTGWTEDGKQIRKIIGYGTNKNEALSILADYHKNPYDLDYKDLTFSDIWEEVEKNLRQLVEQNKMSQSNYEGLLNGYYTHCKDLHNEKIRNIKYKKMQDLIDNAKKKNTNMELGRTGKVYIKNVCKKIFEYAIDIYELPIQKSMVDRLKVGETKISDKHKPFTEKELNLLWKKKDNDIVKILLIFSYTGTRPNELFITNKENIHLQENYFITGSKTKAGKNRIIPIHPRIKCIFEEFYSIDSEYPFMNIFENFTYDKFKKHCKKLMNNLKLDHTPYDGRHTFITRMKGANADQYILKRIVGHSIGDLTEKVYTHRDIETLLNEVKKIK